MRSMFKWGIKKVLEENRGEWTTLAETKKELEKAWNELIAEDEVVIL